MSRLLRLSLLGLVTVAFSGVSSVAAADSVTGGVTLQNGGRVSVGAVSGPNGENPRGALSWDLPGYRGAARVTCVAVATDISPGGNTNLFAWVIGLVTTPNTPSPYVLLRVDDRDAGGGAREQQVAVEQWFEASQCGGSGFPGDFVSSGRLMLRDDNPPPPPEG